MAISENEQGYHDHFWRSATEIGYLTSERGAHGYEYVSRTIHLSDLLDEAVDVTERAVDVSERKAVVHVREEQ